MQCNELFEEAVPDHKIGGHNDWYIEMVTKYEKGGWMVKAKRRLRTRDKFDYHLNGESDKIMFAIHNTEYYLTTPDKTGNRSISKFKRYDNM